jgi:hypothetical protein
VLGLAQDVGAGVELDLSGAVAEIEERGLTVTAAGRDAASRAVAGVGFVSGGQVVMPRVDLADLDAIGERARKRIEPVLPEALELLPPLGQQVGEFLVSDDASLTPDDR